MQGVPPKGSEADIQYDKNSTLMQLYAGGHSHNLVVFRVTAPTVF